MDFLKNVFVSTFMHCSCSYFNGHLINFHDDDDDDDDEL